MTENTKAYAITVGVIKLLSVYIILNIFGTGYNLLSIAVFIGTFIGFPITILLITIIIAIPIVLWFFAKKVACFIFRMPTSIIHDDKINSQIREYQKVLFCFGGILIFISTLPQLFFTTLTFAVPGMHNWINLASILVALKIIISLLLIIPNIKSSLSWLRTRFRKDENHPMD